MAALVIAVLYLGLIELLLIDGQRSLQEAQRFRARVLAGVLAENGAELAAEQMVSGAGAKVDFSDGQGTITGEYHRQADNFEIIATGSAQGVVPEKGRVRLQGRIVGTAIHIDYATHSQ